MADKLLLKVNREDFLKAAKIAGMGADKKGLLPALRHVLIESNGKIVHMRCSNLNTSIQSRFEAIEATRFELLLPIKELIDIAKLCKSEFLLVYERSKTEVVIVCDGSRFKVMGLPADDFPPFEHTESVQMALPGGRFAEALKRVSVAMSRDETRIPLSGCLLEFKGKTIRIVASDGRRLHSEHLKHNSKSEGDHRLIIALDCIELLVKLLDTQYTGDILIGVGHTTCAFYSDSFSVTTRLVAASYPNPDQVIPDSSHTTVTGPVEEWRDCMQRVALAHVDDGGAHIAIGPDGRLKFACENSGALSVECETELKSKAKGASVMVNPDYFLDAINGLTEDDATVGFGGMAALVIKEGRFIAVVMPMRITVPAGVSPPPPLPMDDIEDLVKQAESVIRETQRASATLLKRTMKIGQPKADRLIEILEERGVIGPYLGGKPREIL